MNEEDHKSVQPRRSFILAPGLRPELYPKALASGADIVCVELEDGIAPHDKDEAREKTMALFAEPQADDGVERIGSVLILNLPSREDVERFSANEPLRKAGVFREVKITRMRRGQWNPSAAPETPEGN